MSSGPMTAEDLAETHPELPEGWRRSIGNIHNDGGPWLCPSCDRASYLCYRCSRCGHDLAGETMTSGRETIEVDE